MSILDGTGVAASKWPAQEWFAAALASPDNSKRTAVAILEKLDSAAKSKGASTLPLCQYMMGYLRLMHNVLAHIELDLTDKVLKCCHFRRHQAHGALPAGVRLHIGPWHLRSFWSGFRSQAAAQQLATAPSTGEAPWRGKPSSLPRGGRGADPALHACGQPFRDEGTGDAEAPWQPGWAESESTPADVVQPKSSLAPAARMV